MRTSNLRWPVLGKMTHPMEEIIGGFPAGPYLAMWSTRSRAPTESDGDEALGKAGRSDGVPEGPSAAFGST